jgi:hypothetical protein
MPVLSIPAGTSILLLVVSAFAGPIASRLPARRAARLDVMQALASEQVVSRVALRARTRGRAACSY